MKTKALISFVVTDLHLRFRICKILATKLHYNQCFIEHVGHVFTRPAGFQFYLIQVNKISLIETGKKMWNSQSGAQEHVFLSSVFSVLW